MHGSRCTLSNECPTSHSPAFGLPDELLEVVHGWEGCPERVTNALVLGPWVLKIGQFKNHSTRSQRTPCEILESHSPDF